MDDLTEGLFDFIPPGFILLLILVAICVVAIKFFIKFAAIIVPVSLVVGVCIYSRKKIKKFFT